MGAVYHRASAAPDKNILRVISHSDNLMRNNLPDRQNQVILSRYNTAVDFDINFLIYQSLGNFGNKLCRNLAKLNDIGTPIVNYELIKINRTLKKNSAFLLRHRDMSSQSRHNVNADFGTSFFRLYPKKLTIEQR